MKKQSQKILGKAFAAFVVGALGVAGLWFAPSDAQAGHWNVVFDLRPTTLDWNSGPTSGCGTLFRNTDTPLGAGNFVRCAGGVPAGDNRQTDGNHITHTAITFNAGKGPSGGEYTIPAALWNGGMVLRFADADGNGTPDDGGQVSLIWFSNEQHTQSASIPLFGGDVRVHMHTRGVMADTSSSPNCPGSISVTGQPVRTVTCGGSYDPTGLQALGTWATATRTITWSGAARGNANAAYAGQMANVHNFGYVDCTSSASGCSQGSLSVGLNWKEGNTDWEVAKVTGSGQFAQRPLRNFIFNNAVNFSTATSSLFFSSNGDILADSAASGGAHNSWWNLRGSFYSAVYVPEPGTALLVLGGLIGLVASRRRSS